MDRMRESLFGVLTCSGTAGLAGCSFLDLFSGSGIISLEAASRGASRIEAVEADAGKRRTLLSNAAIAPVRIGCHFMAVELYIKRYGKADASSPAFDFIFCDPPFPYKFKLELLKSIAKGSLMSADSILMMHRPRNERFDEGELAAAKLVLSDRREYGRSIVDFWHLERITN
jgi:16S rRNA (guanine(966)-N(2))-methyltransferase RsmD